MVKGVLMLLRNAFVLNHGDSVSSGKRDVRIKDDCLVEIADSIVPYLDEEVIDLKGKLLLPGFVCSHTHLYSNLSRGITSEIKPTTDFVTILQNMWWKIDRALTKESLFYSAFTGIIESVRAIL